MDYEHGDFSVSNRGGFQRGTTPFRQTLSEFGIRDYLEETAPIRLSNNVQCRMSEEICGSLCRGPSVNPVEHIVTVKPTNNGTLMLDTFGEVRGVGWCDNVTLAGILPHSLAEPTRNRREALTSPTRS